ncbi:MAG: hypothetical protein ACM31C_06255 [Acidobacteriota bacterium]
MVVRLALIASLTGCSFQHGTAGAIAPSDAGGDAAGDASGRIDAPADAHVFLDASQPVLSAVRTTLGQIDINLTTEGTTDWAHWGTVNQPPFFDHKSSGGSMITNVTQPPSLVVSQLPVSASWTDGTPHASVSQTATGIGVTAPAGMTFTVPAGQAVHVLRVYVASKSGTERLDVSLSDGSATAYTDSVTTGSATHYEYAITFAAASDGQTLTVAWTDTNDSTGNGFATLMSATFQ